MGYDYLLSQVGFAPTFETPFWSKPQKSLKQLFFWLVLEREVTVKASD